MTTSRLLFASISSYLDPSSGAALATRELLELLGARRWDLQALSCGSLDYQNQTPLDNILATLNIAARRAEYDLRAGEFRGLYNIEDDEVVLLVVGR
jgi:hypothetical protein